MRKRINKYISKSIGFKLGIALALFLLGFFCRPDLFFIKDIKAAEPSSDAVAIRVIINNEHYSAWRWYKKNDFSGSPQSLTVDGYEAVRDGRTVYVNVANIDNNNLYTNIYLISYNQKAEKETEDIFGQILANWEFNTNVDDAGVCREENSILCSIDDDCAIGDFCDSAKARVTRDTRRLSDLGEIDVLLEEYKTRNGHYPSLNTGSYLPNSSLSVWPSWRQTFSREMGVNLAIDPINKLGDCAGYNEITCWNENTSSFAGILPDLPQNSLVYTYLTDANGNTKRLCGKIESGLTITGDTVISSNCPETCFDNDGDTYGNPATGCDSPWTDCDDNDPDITFGVEENNEAACSNGVDDDCDGVIDCSDSDCAGLQFCLVEYTCGYNGVDSPFEECDDGNASNRDDCLNNCLDAGCGDYFIWDSGSGSEQCDDGNIFSDDGCSSDCQVENYNSACADVDGDYYIGRDIELEYCQDVCGPDHDEECLGNGDCDDNNASRYPNNFEICDGIDNNCDDLVDNSLPVEECRRTCEEQSFTWTGNGSPLNCCGNDLSSESPYQANELNPINRCADGHDNDCDGYYDNASSNPLTPDSDCLGSCFGENSINESFWYIAATPSICDQCSVDGDQDGNNTNDPAAEDWAAVYPGMADVCDPACNLALSDPVVFSNFESSETRCDGVDNDCDGEIDRAPGGGDLIESCYSGSEDTEGVGECRAGSRVCSFYDPFTCEGEITPIGEVCDSGLDEDCDGVSNNGCGACYEDADGDTFGNNNASISVSVCPNDYVEDNTDCDDTRSDIYPGAPEITCDGLNNDCDSSTVDQEEATEVSCGDGRDNDCDDLIDADDPDCDSTNCCTFTITFNCDFCGGSDIPVPGGPPDLPALP